MNYDKYGEVINGEETFKQIAKDLKENKSVIIGWTDGGYDHRDIYFKLGPIRKYGTLQGGLNWNSDLFVGIVRYNFYGFLIENNTNNIKDNGYIKEKLNLKDNSCDDKICDLINGIIKEMDIIGEVYE